MKMISAREYKNDLSDIAGIVCAMKEADLDITTDIIDKALNRIYSPQRIDALNPELYQKVCDYTKMSIPELKKEYLLLREDESYTRNELLRIQSDREGVMESGSIEAILREIKDRKNKGAAE